MILILIFHQVLSLKSQEIKILKKTSEIKLIFIKDPTFLMILILVQFRVKLKLKNLC